jgi:hypothetical protein
MRLGLPVWILAAGAASLAFACANGTTNLYLDEGDLDAGQTNLPERDSGTTKPPSVAPETDASSSTPDSGKDAGVDSATTPPTSSRDCVGTVSAQLASTYDDACDNYYFNTLGDSNPCTLGSTTCAALDTAQYTFCCFKPQPGSYCDLDYGTPQCLPK